MLAPTELTFSIEESEVELTCIQADVSDDLLILCPDPKADTLTTTTAVDQVHYALGAEV